MTRQVINVPNAPKLPFSSAIRAGDCIFVSGQVGIENPETGEVITDVEGQTRQCLENIKQILEMANASLNDVVKVTVFLGNVADYPKMNAV